MIIEREMNIVQKVSAHNQHGGGVKSWCGPWVAFLVSILSSRSRSRVG